ncbi:DUF2188 domain-containing protein [Paludibaculum fermentans]|uniref:DUF2188 domain-containing protein n=1 Tax=Paludibaculum fermentans TaxID=1473598 RepID=UPI003EBB3A84
MSNLRKFTLTHNESKDNWSLKQDETGRVVRNFETKAEAVKGGVLENVLGAAGGSVKIQKENGRIQEERTCPGSKNPRESEG